MNNKDLINKLKDPKYYLENFTKVKTKEHGLQPFILKECQKDLFNALKTNNRIIVLKSRQLGFSTAITGWAYHYAISHAGVTVALVGYNMLMVSELLDKVKTFFITTPKELRPTLQYNSKFEISFPKLESKILVLPNSENVGRGYTLNFVLVTELSSWENAEEKMMGLQESVPKNGIIVIESTPRMQGNLFHRLWVTDNEYLKKDYGWWWGYSSNEMEIKKKSIGPLAFAQEYGLEFLSSGRPVFDQVVLRECRKNILNIGDKIKISEDKEFTVYEKDGWIIYKEPEKDGLYVMGVDVSEGVTGGDYSVAIILDRKTGEEVAMYRGLIAADRFGEILDLKGREYNNALMVVEINNHGLTTVTVLKQKIYPSIYFRPKKFETLETGSSDRMGWRTTKVTRPLLIDDLAQAIREKSLKIHSKIILDEMSIFVYNDNGEMVPQSGFHDDTIFSTAIALQGFKIMFSGELTQLDESKYLPQTYSY
jgi:hypothetical protein